MSEKKSSPYVLKMRATLPPKQMQKALSLPTPWPKFQYEYDSPVIWLPDGQSVWSFDFSFANRGATDQLFGIVLTDFYYGPNQWIEMINPVTVPPGLIFLVNWTIEMLGPSEGSGWWAQMFATSRDIIPSMHVYADTPEPGMTPPYYPDFYFSPGDFAFFDVPRGIVPPGFGEANKP